ncbi:NINE protein [Erythrobacter sp. NE805]|uniref:NINE protein n=1 Tax=Erythrobacter sp. NE805 TaxID=3389875 RepID=UPI00396B4161
MAYSGPDNMEKRNGAGNKLALSYRERMEIEFQLAGRKPRALEAYVRCIALGMFGAHRFYLGDRATGKRMLMLGLTVVGLPVSFAWALRDLFRLNALIEARTEAIYAELLAEALDKANRPEGDARDERTRRRERRTG